MTDSFAPAFEHGLWSRGRDCHQQALNQARETNTNVTLMEQSVPALSVVKSVSAMTRAPRHTQRKKL